MNTAFPQFLIKHFINRFFNRDNIWFKQWATNDRCGYKAIKESITPYLVSRHLRGTVTVAVPALSEDGRSKWLCWDSDASDGKLDRIETFLKLLHFNPLREGMRDGRDGHLWLFLDKPISTEIALLFNSFIMHNCSISEREIEFFPKYKQNLSQIRLPLGIHRKAGAGNARGWFRDTDQEVLTQLRWLEQQPLDTADGVSRLSTHYQSELVKQGFYRRAKKPKHFNQFSEACDINILNLLPEYRRLGKEYAAPCPLCRLEGRDKHGDNLRISLDGCKVNCVLGGPGKLHRTAQIYNFYRKKNVVC